MLHLFFPMKKVNLSVVADLLCDEVTELIYLLPKTPEHVLRPFQATLLMGSKWAAVIAHTLFISCVEKCFRFFHSQGSAHAFCKRRQFCPDSCQILEFLYKDQ